MDSGASGHVTNDRSKLDNVEGSSSNQGVGMARREKHYVKGSRSSTVKTSSKK